MNIMCYSHTCFSMLEFNLVEFESRDASTFHFIVVDGLVAGLVTCDMLIFVDAFIALFALNNKYAVVVAPLDRKLVTCS